jgi:hypothetical protein
MKKRNDGPKRSCCRKYRGILPADSRIKGLRGKGRRAESRKQDLGSRKEERARIKAKMSSKLKGQSQREETGIRKEDREKRKVSRPMVDLAESRDGSIHHLTFQYLGLISQILKRLL